MTSRMTSITFSFMSTLKVDVAALPAEEDAKRFDLSGTGLPLKITTTSLVFDFTFKGKERERGGGEGGKLIMKTS